jgi:FMN phosphatase YigB (HAD superfamily)
VIDAVVFDVGETLVDETREYGTWADWLGVPRHTFSSVFGAVIALGMDYREAFQYFRPGFDLVVERERRADAGQPETFGEGDLYPDARPAMAALRDMGVWVGVAGNQTSRAGEILRKPARKAGMLTAFIRRGPWGYIWERHPDMPVVADWRMATLAELPGIVAEVNRSAR